MTRKGVQSGTCVGPAIAQRTQQCPRLVNYDLFYKVSEAVVVTGHSYQKVEPLT